MQGTVVVWSELSGAWARSGKDGWRSGILVNKNDTQEKKRDGQFS